MGLVGRKLLPLRTIIVMVREQRQAVHTKGYQAMGSFHSENVDELMMQSDDVYQPPHLPPDINNDNHHHNNNNRDDDFLLDRKQWKFLNHGAFGAALRVGCDRAEQWRFHLESQPLRYHDRELLPHLVYSARRLAKFCSASRDAFTLIPNVTYGLNTVLRGYVNHYQEDAQIVLWDTTYGSLKKMAHVYCPQHVTEIPVSDYFDRWRNPPLEDPSSIFAEALQDTLMSMMGNGNKPVDNALLILDHTTSNTALNMPLKSLSKVAKENSMLVMVDGAHGILAQDLALNERELPHIDFYVGNGHKWLCCPRGIGFLYCPHADLRDSILKHPACISHGIGQGFQSRFLWDGCRDYAAALAVPAVLDYWEQEQNPIQVRNKIQSKLREAVWLLSESWHGGDINGSLLAPTAVHAPMMVLVKLPEAIQSSMSSSLQLTSDDAKEVQDYLYDNSIEVPIKCVRGGLYVRLSCHIYNEIDEYQQLADTMLQFFKT